MPLTVPRMRVYEDDQGTVALPLWGIIRISLVSMLFNIYMILLGDVIQEFELCSHQYVDNIHHVHTPILNNS